MYILGLNTYHPDSSAAIISDGKLIAACEEERFRRIKHFAGFPSESIKYCLKEAGISIKDIDYVGIPRKPEERIFKKIFYGLKIPRFIQRRLFTWQKTLQVKEELAKIFDIDKKKLKAKIIKVEHHRAHLSSSFFVSDFDEAFLFSCDALGDFASGMWGIGQGNNIKILGEITFPHSLGFYYSALTQYLGFLNFGDEYKVMGLAAYGEPVFESEFKKILKIKKKGFELGLRYFLHHKKFIDMNFENGYPQVDLIFSSYLEKMLGKRRLPHQRLEKRHYDIASSLQKRLEEAIFHLLNSFNNNLSNLCLSGGVAFNCVANAKIFDNTQFQKIYIPPAPGDAGLAIGVAYYLWNQVFNKSRNFVMQHAYWGPQFSEDEINKELNARIKELNDNRYIIEKIENEDELCQRTARYISEGKVVGWFQGRMEWGPRALGNRSIIVDPRRQEMKDFLNKRIKYREPFRPFAPSILEEYIGEYFENYYASPFMLFTHKVRREKEKLIPAVVHVDGTARLQAVNRNTNPLYWRLINEFRKLSGIPLVLNTSFNENEPIVSTPKEAFNCFLKTKMDLLVLQQYLIKKN